MSGADLNRLLRPRSVAVFGGGWARNVVEQCLKADFDGEIWPVHPSAADMHGVPCFRSVEELPATPDAAFVGVNREASVELVRQLRDRGCGGVICFASGYGEAQAEDSRGLELEQLLLSAAGDMPIIGPNCYGLLNYAEGAMLWPDQHGGKQCDSGIALLTQSSNIAINLTMQQRGLPIVYVMTAGNQLQLSIGQLGQALLKDERVTALGLYIESVGDIREFEAMAALGRELGKPMLAIKAGRSANARLAMLSHTNSLAGDDAAADAFLKRLGIVRVDSPTALIESLKLMHQFGPLSGNRLQSMSCSGGEAALMADSIEGLPQTLCYSPLQTQQLAALREALGPKVALANPLDYHTYIWDDFEAMRSTFAAMMCSPAEMTVLVLDFPRSDRCDATSWDNAVAALAMAAREAGRPAAVLATLPENLSEQDAEKIMAQGLVPLGGIQSGLQAIAYAVAAGRLLQQNPAPLALSQLQAERGLAIVAESVIAESAIAASAVEKGASQLPHTLTQDLSEAAAKKALAAAGVDVPQAQVLSVTTEGEWIKTAVDSCSNLRFPVVLKVQRLNGEWVQHKSDIGGVVLNIEHLQQLASCLTGMHDRLNADTYLVEEQIGNVLAELLVSVIKDEVYGLMLTVAAGGVYTELLQDSEQVLLPASRQDLLQMVAGLRVATLLEGYRGASAVPMEKLISTIDALQQFALQHQSTLLELEINPLLCCADRITAGDTILRFG